MNIIEILKYIDEINYKIVYYISFRNIIFFVKKPSSNLAKNASVLKIIAETKYQR